MGKWTFITVGTAWFLLVSLAIQTAFGVESAIPIAAAMSAGVALDIAANYALNQGWV